MVITMVVLAAAVFHAVWNALSHAITDKVVATTSMGIAFVGCGIPVILLIGTPAVASWPFIVISATVHYTYMWSLMRSYRLGAFNHVYPLARGMSPWVVALIAALVLGESLGVVQWIGVLVVSLGLGSLVFASGRPHRDELPAVGAAVMTGLLIATYTLIDGVGVRQSGDSIAYAAWLFLLHGSSLVVYGFWRRGRSLWGELGVNVRFGVPAGLFSVLGYGMVLWAQSRGDLATVAALRETSVIVGAIIGAVVFSEPFGRWRTVATVVVAGGIALLNLG